MTSYDDSRWERWDIEGGETPLIDPVSGEMNVPNEDTFAFSEPVSEALEAGDTTQIGEMTQPIAPPVNAPVSIGDAPLPLMTLLFRPRRAAELRIEALTRAIERHPNAPSIYVLRGEMRLKLGRYADAEMDFRRALDLAAAQVESQDWGVVAQVAQDRALAGLKHTLSRRNAV